MGDFPETTSQENPFQDMSFVSPPCGAVGPPFMATLNLPGLTIGLLVWLFSTHVIPNASFVSDPSPLPHEHQPHVNPSPSSSNVESTSISSSSSVENSKFSKCACKKKMKRKAKKKNTKQKVIPSATKYHAGSIDVPVFGTRKAKFPCMLSSLVYFARMITLSRTIVVFPLCQKCGINIMCC